MKYKFLPHTADIKFRAYGKSLNGLFENCALAFSNHLSRGSKIKSIVKKNFSLEEKDLPALLYSFLDELIYLLDAEDFVVSKAGVSIEGTKLKAEVYGDDVENYQDLDHINAATYSEMYVKKKLFGWEAQVVLDV